MYLSPYVSETFPSRFLSAFHWLPLATCCLILHISLCFHPRNWWTQGQWLWYVLNYSHWGRGGEVECWSISHISPCSHPRNWWTQGQWLWYVLNYSHWGRGGEGRWSADQYRISHPALTRGTDELRGSDCGMHYSHWGRGGEGRWSADQYRICHPAPTRGTDELRDSGCGTYYSHWGRGGRVGCWSISHISPYSHPRNWRTQGQWLWYVIQQ